MLPACAFITQRIIQHQFTGAPYKAVTYIHHAHEEIQISLLELHTRLVCVFITQRFTRVVYRNSI